MLDVSFDEGFSLVEQIVRRQTTNAAERTFPDDECPPAAPLQCLDGQAIPFLGSKDFRGPKFSSRPWELRESASMAVPEAAID